MTSSPFTASCSSIRPSRISRGLRRAAKEVDQYLTGKRKQSEELASSIEQKREEFLTEQADKLENLANRIRDLAGRVNDRNQLIELYFGLGWLERLSDRVLAGEVLLEEDAQSCLRLATLLEQAEARLEHLTTGPRA